VSKESTIKAIDVTLEGMRWAKMRGEHSDADMFRQIYAELVALANEVYGTSWVGKLKNARGLVR
jgi:hypothetical protein